MSKGFIAAARVVRQLVLGAGLPLTAPTVTRRRTRMKRRYRYPPGAWIVLAVAVALCTTTTVGALHLLWEQWQLGFPPEGPGIAISVGLIAAALAAWASMIMGSVVGFRYCRTDQQKEKGRD